MTPQTPITTAVAQDFRVLRDDLRMLRDEVRLKVHLAAMDVKQDWQKLEPQVDQFITGAVAITTEAANDVKKRLSEFRQRLNGP
jgi:hypothetical protein